MGRACSTNGNKMNAYRILVRKPEGKRPLGRPRRKWVDNIKINLREIGWDGKIISVPVQALTWDVTNTNQKHCRLSQIPRSAP
jgi:hypothetical protein